MESVTMRTYYPWNEIVVSPLLWGQIKKQLGDGALCQNGTQSLKEKRVGAGSIAINVKEIENGVEVSCFCPGADEGKFDVEASEDTLTIKGEVPAAAEDEKYLVREVKSGEFFREIRLPFTIDRDSVDAVFSKGVLTIAVKKVVENPEKKITIRVQ
jgi:HSP20 family protein